MVSQLSRVSTPTRPRAGRTSRAKRGASRERLLAAAASEFAARGFDGAKVDRIAAVAGVNKAMLYYHFGSKATLYRFILRQLFSRAADAVGEIRSAEAPPEDHLRRFVETVGDNVVAQPHFAGIWLREMADGGRHLDASVVAEMGRIIDALAGILGDGLRAGRFQPANPLVIHMGIVAPLLLFTASASLRGRFADRLPPGTADIMRGTIVRHVQDVTLLALTSTAKTGRRTTRPRAKARVRTETRKKRGRG